MTSVTGPEPGSLRGAFFGLAAFAIFSTHDLLIKYLGGHYSPFQIIFFSSLISFPFITLLIIRDGKPGTLRPVHPWWMLLRSLSGVTAAVGAFYAFSVLPLAQVYAILFAAPLLITLLSVPILGETVRLRRGLAVVVGLMGVIVVLRPGTAELGLGHVAALLSAVAGAFNSIVVRKIGQDERPVLMILYPMLASVGLMAIALPAVYRPMPLIDLGALAVVSVMVLIAMSCLIAAYRRSPAVVVAPMQYSQILWAALYGSTLFGEYPDAMTYLGAAIITASGLYILRREYSGKVSRHTPVLETKTRIGLDTSLRVGASLDNREPPK